MEVRSGCVEQIFAFLFVWKRRAGKVKQNVIIAGLGGAGKETANFFSRLLSFLPARGFYKLPTTAWRNAV